MYLSTLLPFLKTIHKEIMVLDEEMKLENYVTPFMEGSNKASLWRLISHMVADFEQRRGTGYQGTYLSDNEKRGKVNRPSWPLSWIPG
jgi:hypothetical protein